VAETTPRRMVGTVTVAAHRVGQSERKGEILDVLGNGREHYLVRWEDGSETVFYPSSDAVVRLRPDLTGELERAGVAYEVITHERTMTALDEARAVDAPPDTVAKTLVLEGETGFVRAVLPASGRIDMKKVRRTLDDGGLELASEPTIARAYAGFELGAVPPLGGDTHDPVLLDTRLTGCESVIFEAGSHTESIRMSPDDLKTVTGATVADICAD
jgi:Ala-tRNA(Pro) deacylase